MKLMKRQLKIGLISLVLLLIALFLSISVGPVKINILDFSQLNQLQKTILFDIRIPRALLALIVGSALATSGAVYQTVFRNPLADPYLLGAAAGAGLCR